MSAQFLNEFVRSEVAASDDVAPMPDDQVRCQWNGAIPQNQGY
jgi:hypothetical protein